MTGCKTTKARAAALLLAFLILFTLCAPSMAAANNAQVQYSVKSGVNVRSGPGTNYKILGKLKKGDLIDGAAAAEGKWINVSYDGQSAYIHSSYLKATGVINQEEPSEPKRPTNIVYTRRKVEVTSRAGGGTTVGTLYMGARAVRLDVKTNHTQISCEGKKGYVRTRDLEYMTGTGAYEMEPVNEWRYSAGFSNNAYLMPLESDIYRVGYFTKDEAVWVMNGNEYWVQIYVNGRTAYMPTSKLTAKPAAASKEKVSTGPYAPGTFLTVAKGGASPTDSYAMREAYIPVYEDYPYGRISEGTRVLVMLCTNKYAQIMWEDDRDYEVGTGVNFPTNLHTAFVRINSIG